jgi:hypothetical protein
MKIEELDGDKTYTGVCHDCGNLVEVKITLNKEGEIKISGGAVFKIRQGLESLLFYKCDACFKRDKILRNFRPCEVWSRVVGYLRPVSQYNLGKKAEYKMRKEFTNTEGK